MYSLRSTCFHGNPDIFHGIANSKKYREFPGGQVVGVQLWSGTRVPQDNQSYNFLKS